MRSQRELDKMAALGARYHKRIADAQATKRTITAKLAEDPGSCRAAQWAARIDELDAMVLEYQAHLAGLVARGARVPQPGDHEIAPAAGSIGATGSEA